MATPTFILGDKNWGIKESNLLGATPVNNGYLQRALTFNSSADITRTNSYGNVQRSPWNIIQYSNAFSNAAWTKSFSSITTSTISSPIGTTDVSLWSEDTTNNQHRMYISNSDVGIFTASVFVKYSGRQYFGIRIYNNDGTKYALKLYDVLNGTLGTQSVLGLGATYSITSAGSGWYRCILTIDTSIINSNLLFFLADTNTITDAGGTTYTGNGSGVYIWGAQLVGGSQPLDYLSTTNRLNVPRIDYSQGVGCLLLEPQRTNLVTYSNDFSNSIWLKDIVTVTSNTTDTTDVSKTYTASKISATSASNDLKYSYNFSALTYTASIYIKAGTLTSAILFFSGIDKAASFDLTAKVISSAGFGTLPDSYSITNIGNGWFRCSITTLMSAGIKEFRVRINSGDIYVCNSQLEQGSYATSYIPTTSASVTRIADTFSRSNIYTDGLISSAGGTWVVELRNNIGYTRDSAGTLSLDTNSSGLVNGFSIRNSASTNRLYVAKVVSNIITYLYFLPSDIIKIAIKWNGSTADVFVNGSKVVSGTSFITTNMEYLLGNAIDVPKYIKSMSLYNTPLSDSECAQITSDITN